MFPLSTKLSFVSREVFFLEGGRGEILNKVYTERLDPEVQPFITLLSTNFLTEKVPLSYTFYREMVPLSHT